MKAAMHDRYGPPEVIELREVEKPKAAEGEVLIRVRAASVNRADLDGLKPKPGFIRLFYGLRAPRDPRVGIDAAGVVETVGAGVTRFKPGDEVFADLFTAGGAFAEYAKAKEKFVEPMPTGMSFEEASTLPHSAVLALQGLRGKGKAVKAGDRVLVVGASGNVGPFAVQMAKAMGAHVTGVATTSKLDLVRSLGADAVMDYTTTDFTRSGERWDWIVDVDSHHSILGLRRALRPGGLYLTMGGTSSSILGAMLVGPLRSLFDDKWTGMMLWWKPFHGPDLEQVLAWIAEGKVKPVIDRTYPLSEVVEALRWVEDGHARGKVVITF